jgi:hypothetical protein
VNPELAFGALYANYVFVGTAIRTAIDLANWLGPGVFFTFIVWGCVQAVDRWRNWRWRRHEARIQLPDIDLEPDVDTSRLEDAIGTGRIDTRPGIDRDALNICLAMWDPDSTDTREEESK